MYDCFVWFHLNVPSRQVYGDWKWMSGCRELGEDEESLRTSTGFLSGEMKVFQNWLWWWLHNFEYTKHHWTEYFKWDEFYSMQNYVWIKLLFYKKKRKRLKGILGRNHSWKPLSTKAYLGGPEQTCVAGTWSGNAKHGMQNGSPQRNTALPILWLEPSEINMCYFQSPVLWSFGYSRSKDLIQVSIIDPWRATHIWERSDLPQEFYPLHGF